MKIGFDAKRAVSNMTGLGNYSRLLIEEIGKAMPESQLLLYTPKMRENPRLEKIRGLKNAEFRFPPAQSFKGSLWRSFGVTNNLTADKVVIFHGLSNELPLNITGHGVKTVVTIHDLIFMTMPHCYKPIDRLLYRYKYGKACRNADRIIAISECTKKDIINYFGIEDDKIRVIYQGCDDIFREEISRESIEEIRQKYSLPETYIIQVGTIEERKNLEESVRALSALPEDIHLVAVGRDHYGYKKRVIGIAEETGVRNRLHFLEGVPFKDLPTLYAGALAAVYPSRYEGFGIPVIEAIETGTPLIAAEGSCLREAGGESSIYVSPDDPNSLAEAILTVRNNEEKRREMIGDGKEYVKRFSNEGMAREVEKLYRELANQENQ